MPLRQGCCRNVICIKPVDSTFSIYWNDAHTQCKTISLELSLSCWIENYINNPIGVVATKDYIQFPVVMFYVIACFPPPASNIIHPLLFFLREPWPLAFAKQAENRLHWPTSSVNWLNVDKLARLTVIRICFHLYSWIGGRQCYLGKCPHTFIGSNDKNDNCINRHCKSAALRWHHNVEDSSWSLYTQGLQKYKIW